jgi:hypothetical protein
MTKPVHLEEVSLQQAQTIAPQPKLQPSPLAASVATAGPVEVVDAIIAAKPDDLLPWEEASLPSRGIYYGWSGGTIQVRPWGINVDRILANQRLAQSGQSIDHILATCCMFPDGFDVADLLVGDQIYLLYHLRCITHGNVYDFSTRCPNPDCAETVLLHADLNELANTIIWTDEGLGPEPFQVKLPHLSQVMNRDVTVGVRFLRVRDTHSVLRNRRTIRKHVGAQTVHFIKRGDRSREEKSAPDQGVDILSQNLDLVVANVMGVVTDRMKIREFMERMHSTDLAVMREWLAEHTPGIQTTVAVTCQSCGMDFDAMLPITEAFFRPADVGGIRS